MAFLNENELDTIVLEITPPNAPIGQLLAVRVTDGKSYTLGEKTTVLARRMHIAPFEVLFPLDMVRFLRNLSLWLLADPENRGRYLGEIVQVAVERYENAQSNARDEDSEGDN